ncbi:MAG: threonine synthase [Nitrososphaerota archaeon]|nr:threonine synthase [Nitrososphaerales archaeon]MDW8044390.1 threonine synthase [Nitrososphaerota archaeon]
MHIVCINCRAQYSIDENIYTCRKCGDLLEIELDIQEVKRKLDEKWRFAPLSVWKYSAFIPIRDPSKIVTLGEGGTRLHFCQRLARELGIKNLYVKNEGDNPTASFKDRGITVGVTRACELNAKNVICASTGNTSASLAAYAAKAGLTCYVLVPSGKIAYGKLVQAIIHGAKVIRIRGDFDQALRMVLKVSHEVKDVYLLNSINPFRIEGQKTLSYEICEQLNRPPDWIVIPVGNAGNISAVWKGLVEFKECGMIEGLPKLAGIQAEGAAPIVKAFEKGLDRIEPIQNPETIASAIRIGAPASWKKALRAIRESKGIAVTVSDNEILKAQRDLASREGLFVEPASASTIAGLRKLLELNIVKNDDLVVCIATGHGLKDPDAVLKSMDYYSISEIEADTKSLIDLLKGGL